MIFNSFFKGKKKKKKEKIRQLMTIMEKVIGCFLDPDESFLGL